MSLSFFMGCGWCARTVPVPKSEWHVLFDGRVPERLKGFGWAVRRLEEGHQAVLRCTPSGDERPPKEAWNDHLCPACDTVWQEAEKLAGQDRDRRMTDAATHRGAVEQKAAQ